jgi:hypothetical protein
LSQTTRHSVKPDEKLPSPSIGAYKNPLAIHARTKKIEQGEELSLREREREREKAIVKREIEREKRDQSV